MVKDRTNTYYTGLLQTLKESYSGIKASQVYKATPPSFPYMYFKQIGGSTALTTLSATEDGVTLALEVKFYSNVSANDVRNMANLAREYMVETLGFTVDYFSPVENVSDSAIYQFLARFSKLET